MTGIKGKGGVKGRSGGARLGAGRKKSNIPAANQQMAPAPKEADREAVSIAAAYGVAHECIAEALGISLSSLRSQFEAELSTGAARRRMDVLEAMYLAARKGNVNAQKAYLAASPVFWVPPPAAPESPKPLAGKKEQAAADAQVAHVGTEWEDLLKPPSRLQ